MENQTTPTQTDVVGSLLKWASPVMIAIIGYLIMGYLEGIKGSIEEIRDEIKSLQTTQKEAEIQNYKNEIEVEILKKRLEALESKKAYYYRKEDFFNAPKPPYLA